MKISLEWLREYVDYQDSPEKLDEILTNVGFPVEGIERVGDDWMLDVEITSNRPDCLGHIGIAREVAAATGCAFRMPEVNYTETGKDVTEWTGVVNEAPDLCGRYTARMIDEVKIGPSPDWLVRRLETIGLRGISNVVDITNYVLMEIGQPLHSFDYAQLEEGRIVVRRAKNGEKMVSIDHTELELNNRMLVIADASQPVAMAGIMGGLASEVGDQTKSVLLESAHFDPLCTRRSSRALTLSSESSFRFERNVDIVMVDWASRRAAALLEQFASGKVAPGVIDVWPADYTSRQVGLRLPRLNLLLGIEIPVDTVLGILSRLGLEPQLGKEGVVSCTIPSWRSDLVREVDLIEEVIRIQGYGSIPMEPRIHITVKTQDEYQRACQKVTTALNGCGFYETIGVSFVDDRHWQPFMPEGFEPVRVQDMTRKSNNALRPSLLPSLLEASKRNQDAGNEHCELYELAACHKPNGSEILPNETICLSMLTDGAFQELRGAIESVLAALDKNIRLTCQSDEILWADPEAGSRLLVGDICIGSAGKLRSDILNQFDLNENVCLAEIDFGELVKLQGGVTELIPLIRFPGVTRDLSLVLDESIAWVDIESLIHDQNIADLREVRFVGIYRGKGVEKGRKSLTLSLHFRRADETLTHEAVDAYQETILSGLKEKLNADLRA
jgi:phenylalanyl-tRNA synthetase beta chain